MDIGYRDVREETVCHEVALEIFQFHMILRRKKRNK